MERALRVKLRDGKFESTPPQRSRMMQAVHGKNNRTTEQRLRLGLVRSTICGWKVRPQGLKGNPDFFFAAEKMAIFVDGCFWHGCPLCGHLPQMNRSFWSAKISHNRQRDRKTTIELKEQGIRVLRFWEHELQVELERCIEKIISTRRFLRLRYARFHRARSDRCTFARR